MSKRDRGPDLIPPGQVETIPGVVIIDTPGGPAWAETIGAAAWADAQHNMARYAESQKLRMGQPNRYRETRYRT